MTLKAKTTDVRRSTSRTGSSHE